MRPMTREDLDVDTMGGCGEEGCTHKHNGPLYFHPICHRDAALRIQISPFEPKLLHLECSRCGKLVEHIQIVPVRERKLPLENFCHLGKPINVTYLRGSGYLHLECGPCEASLYDIVVASEHEHHRS